METNCRSRRELRVGRMVLRRREVPLLADESTKLNAALSEFKTCLIDAEHVRRVRRDVLRALAARASREDELKAPIVWMSRLQEARQDIVHHLSHVYVGALLTMAGAGTGWYPWQSGAAAACGLGVLWEIVPAIYVKSPDRWRASAIGMLSFGAGAAAASIALLAAGR